MTQNNGPGGSGTWAAAAARGELRDLATAAGRPNAQTVAIMAGFAHDPNDLLRSRRSGGHSIPCCAAATGQMPGDRLLTLLHTSTGHPFYSPWGVLYVDPQTYQPLGEAAFGGKFGGRKALGPTVYTSVPATPANVALAEDDSIPTGYRQVSARYGG